MTPSFFDQLVTIVGMGAVTFLTRALPFLQLIPRSFLKKLKARENTFPTMFLTLLVLYCLVPPANTPTFSPRHLQTLGIALAVGALHWTFGKLLVSLFLGTGLYLWLLNY